jgi:phosphoglycerol transferase MdoB-like AlkP superfamily enzyme
MHFVLAILVFTILLLCMLMYRLIFYFQFDISSQIHDTNILWQSIMTGVRFDIITTAYLTIIPLLLIIFHCCLNPKSKAIAITTKIALSITAIIQSLIMAADFAFFRQYHIRITKAIHLWNDNLATTLNFIFTDKNFYPQIIACILLSTFLIYVFIKIINHFLILKNKPRSVNQKWIQTISMIILLVIAMRGGVQPRPMGVRNAFVFNNEYLNQFALNPVVSYIDSYQLISITSMADKEALQNVRDYLHLQKNAGELPLLQKVIYTDSVVKKNIVIILMESMTASMMGYYGNKNHHTPFLDSLSKHAICFTNFYSMGIHTCNGMFGTLYSLPSLGVLHPMASISFTTQQFGGLPFILKNAGYKNIFFCSHEPNFDNTEMFLTKNHFDKIYSSANYPPQKKVNAWGVSDEFLFQYATERIDELTKNANLVMATILTISTHPPQEMPHKTIFKPRSNEAFSATFEYADWSLQQFFETAKTKSWYENTVFVLIADHGTLIPNYEADFIAQNHSPFLIFDPTKNYVDSVIGTPCNQTDVVPTLMNVFQLSHNYIGLGTNIFTKKNPYTYFMRDDLKCVTDGKFLLTINKLGTEIFYNLNTKKVVENVEMHSTQISEMKKYCFSFLQSAEYCIDNKLLFNKTK